MDASEVIREVRQRAGLTLRELAERARTSHSTLAAYERGRKVPRVDTLARICRASGFAVDAALTPRPSGAERRRRGQALEDVLELADAYPLRRTGPMELPVFGRSRADVP
ncbi:MAG TPA: helix-turn-helix transcriptional regulator [Nitriliruptorales bacterium]